MDDKILQIFRTIIMAIRQYLYGHDWLLQQVSPAAFSIYKGLQGLVGRRS